MRRYNHLQEQHRLLMASTVSLLEYATTLANGVLPQVAHEWPKTCRYWKTDLVTTYVQHYQLEAFQCDGCMMGVTSKFRSSVGKPIKKSWLIKTNVDCIGSALAVKCDRTHDHVPCQGQDTRLTERYPRKFALALHTGWRQHDSSHVMNSVVLARVGSRVYTRDPIITRSRSRLRLT